jgi:uracil-DNA glycosylase family 4
MTKKEKVEEPSPYPIWMDETARTVEGKIWLRGRGPLPAPFMFVGERPLEKEVKAKRVFHGATGELLNTRLVMNGFDTASCYLTNAVKYPIPRNKNAAAKDLKVCHAMLEEEIKRCNPKVIVCLGSAALRAVVGRDMNISSIRGELVRDPVRNVDILAMHNPAYVLHNPEVMAAFDRDICELVRYQRGEQPMLDPADWVEIRTVAWLREFVASVFAEQANPVLVIDMEWNGKTWMDPDRYIRTIQICHKPGQAVIVVMRGENGVPAMDDEPEAWRILKTLLEDPRVGIIGHNAIADGHWLLGQNIDIRPRVIWDTMLAEFLLHETGPWGLEEVTLRYTNHRRYSLNLEMWVNEHKTECKHGYGPVPESLLFPYGAIDVIGPRQIAEKQYPLVAAEFMQPRGLRGQYPSLWQTTLRTQELLYELERNGMAIDTERLEQLIVAYQRVRAQLLGVVTTEAAAAGFIEFSPTSVQDVQKMLFQVLKLPPVKTTEGRAWVDDVGNQGLDNPTESTPSTDKTTLEILEDEHALVHHLLQFRRIDQSCKTWLRHPKEGEDEVSKGGGIGAKIWADGRIHARFSQLAETGRFRTAQPNVQNWPKKAEGYMEEIFGKDNMPPGIRTIIVPAPGYVLMEGDFVQAELFVLAALSGDQNMMSALTTPGRDLHDVTAITAFKLKVYDPQGNEVPESVLIDLAKKNLPKGSESKEFKSFVKTLRYVDLRGKVMTRDEFKETIRVSAKNVNFGIPYGRGALDIARQVKAETGSKQTIQELETDLSEIVRVWKEETYATAWAYMRRCAQSVYDPGYIKNPWGRYRRFPRARNDEERADVERQAQNFPIQSTVADTAMIAMDLIARYREANGLHFRIVNQIHDAVMIETPIDEIDQCKLMYGDTMGAIDIPVGPPFNILRLGVDMKILTRWGEEAKSKD